MSLYSQIRVRKSIIARSIAQGQGVPESQQAFYQKQSPESKRQIEETARTIRNTQIEGRGRTLGGATQTNTVVAYTKDDGTKVYRTPIQYIGKDPKTGKAGVTYDESR